MKEKEEGEELDRGRIWLVIYAWQYLGQSAGSLEQELLLSGFITGPSWSTCCLKEACYLGQMVLCSWSSPWWGWGWRLSTARTHYSWSTSILRRGICVIHLYIYHWCSVSQSCPALCDPMECSTPGLSVPHHLPKFAQGHVHCIGDVIQPSHPLMPFSPARSLSQHQGLFQSVRCSHQMTKYWSFSFSFSPSNKYSGLISLEIDWFNLLAVQGTLGSFRSTTMQRHQFLAIHLLYGLAITTTLGRP